MSKDISKKTQRVVVAMSGGVDSSVAAYLLKKQGYDVIGVFLKFWQPEYSPVGATPCGRPKKGGHAGPPLQGERYDVGNAKENTCCDLRSLVKARQIAGQLRIPFYVVNVSSQFKKYIVDHFISEYEAGRTPNPCVLCNRKVKFGLLWEKAKALGADYLATGHYVRAAETPSIKSQIPIKSQAPNSKIKNKPYDLGFDWALGLGRSDFSLLRGKDSIKDQTYFLSSIDRDVIPHLLFPLGNKVKKEVREIAKRAGLPVYSKKDSVGICFIPDGDTARFLDFYTKKLRKPGKIVDKHGNILGRHNGLLGYTIGQKVGDDEVAVEYFKFKILNFKFKIRPDIPRLYVTKIDTKENQLTIGENEDCFGDEMVVEKINIINDKFWDLVSNGKKMYFQIRGGHKAEAGYIRSVGATGSVAQEEGRSNGSPLQATVKFIIPVRAITPGQTVAIYNRNTLLGGGIIK